MNNTIKKEKILSYNLDRSNIRYIDVIITSIKKNDPDEDIIKSFTNWESSEYSSAHLNLSQADMFVLFSILSKEKRHKLLDELHLVERVVNCPYFYQTVRESLVSNSKEVFSFIIVSFKFVLPA